VYNSVNSLEESTFHAFDETIGLSLQDEQVSQRSTILRVYNYYRILISFLFLFLFLDPNFQRFVGSVNPDMFQKTILTYISVNILIGLTTLFVRVEVLSKTTPSLIILIGDIVCLTLLMSASGGVSSGLANFLIFTLAFGGGLIHGRVSTVLPAIAFILTIYDEFYLFFLDANTLRSFFQAGILGIVYFAANILFQTLSRQLRTRETEVRALEQRSQLIIERMRVGVVVVTDTDQPRLINQSAAQMLQVPGDRLSPKDHLPDILLDKISGWKQNPSPEVSPFTVYDTGPELLASFSLLNEPSSDSDTLVFIEDSTDVQKQAQQFKLASLGRLSASIAHEIRNPLGAISHAAQLLGESSSLDKGDKRLSEIIQNHTVRMNGVIENVLQMSSRQNAEPREVALQDWVGVFLEEFSAGVADELIIETEFLSEQLPIEFDPLHLSQVLGNLYQNGLRYSAKSTGENKLKVICGIDPNTGKTYLEVIDYGKGVDEDLIHNLFEPFYTTESMGTGLGLYLSKELCEANNARLSYSKADTGGSCFRIAFLT
jgi:two-component system sensor histidine kinase PilS (NtrC family)|tara:strand:- start:5981 stop:7612 length:1632 start_codon:yes stop_codon:yes gene_type:complete